MVPIVSKRLDMDEQETQRSLLHHENEKRYKELKMRNEQLKLDITQVSPSLQFGGEFCFVLVSVEKSVYWNTTNECTIVYEWHTVICRTRKKPSIASWDRLPGARSVSSGEYDSSTNYRKHQHKVNIST